MVKRRKHLSDNHIDFDKDSRKRARELKNQQLESLAQQKMQSLTEFLKPTALSIGSNNCGSVQAGLSTSLPSTCYGPSTSTPTFGGMFSDSLNIMEKTCTSCTLYQQQLDHEIAEKLKGILS